MLLGHGELLASRMSFSARAELIQSEEFVEWLNCKWFGLSTGNGRRALCCRDHRLRSLDNKVTFVLSFLFRSASLSLHKFVLM
jgi:hypothetical protein